jgi:hypothetical protein
LISSAIGSEMIRRVKGVQAELRRGRGQTLMLKNWQKRRRL